MLLCVACNKEHDHQGRTPLVELEGNFLYQEDLQTVMPAGLSAEDSLRFAGQYIRNWVEDVLLFDKAKRNIPNSAEVDRLVENYRKALIVHTYQQALIHQQLAEEITEEELAEYYAKHQELFRAERPLMKGLFIKVPLQAAQLANVRRWYKDENQEAVEHLEKYSLQHAVQYEYFYDHWVQASEILDLMPMQVDDLEELLRKDRRFELKDTAFHYFLNVTDYRAVGEQEPYEWARTAVRDILMNLKQVEFMNSVKDDLYRRAEEDGKIKKYNKDNKTSQ